MDFRCALVPTLAICIAFSVFEVAEAQAKPKPKAKPKPAVAAKALPGGVGALNVPVRIGEGDEAFQVILTEASFASRVVNADDTIVPGSDKKLLILKFTVQNPGSKNDRFYRGDSFHWTVVGASADNYQAFGTAYNPDKSTPVSLNLKPAQKVPVWTYVEVPNDEPVPKLMLSIPDSKNVVRYDLRGKVKPITGAFAGPDGVKALPSGVAKLGDTVPVGYLDWSVGAPQILDKSPVPAMEVEEAAKFVVFPITVANPGLISKYFRYDSAQYELADADDLPIEIERYEAFRMSSAEGFAGDLKPGQSVKLRLVFRIGANAKAASLTLKDPEKLRTVKISL